MTARRTIRAPGPAARPGWTLTELLVVLAIITVLVGVAFVADWKAVAVYSRNAGEGQIAAALAAARMEAIQRQTTAGVVFDQVNEGQTTIDVVVRSPEANDRYVRVDGRPTQKLPRGVAVRSPGLFGVHRPFTPKQLAQGSPRQSSLMVLFNSDGSLGRRATATSDTPYFDGNDNKQYILTGVKDPDNPGMWKKDPHDVLGLPAADLIMITDVDKIRSARGSDGVLNSEWPPGGAYAKEDDWVRAAGNARFIAINRYTGTVLKEQE